MPKFSANLSLMFAERPMIERFGAARAAGFDAVEVQFPYDDDAAAIAGELARHGLVLTVINGPPPNYAGGPRGFEGFFDALAPEFERWWDSLGEPRFDAETRAALVGGMAAADPRSVAEIGAARDRQLPELLEFLRGQRRKAADQG